MKREDEDGSGGQVTRAEHFWRAMAKATSLAWNIVTPIVGGTLLGRFIDDRVGEEDKWTITLLFIGTFIAFYNLYQMLFKES